MLTFIDIYNKTTIAAENGDFLLVIEQMARFVRRVLDFDSMQRETLIKDIDQTAHYLSLMAKAPPKEATPP